MCDIDVKCGSTHSIRPRASISIRSTSNLKRTETLAVAVSVGVSGAGTDQLAAAIVSGSTVATVSSGSMLTAPGGPVSVLATTDSVADAMAALAGDGCVPLAGGTWIMRAPIRGEIQSRRYIGIGRIPELNTIEMKDDEVSLGACVTHARLVEALAGVAQWNGLAAAAGAAANPAVREMATVGGNLLQRPRCPYFRDAAIRECNKRSPGTGCAALGGYTRMHAILGGSDHCIAAHPSDMAVALLALDAIVHTQGSASTRSIPIAEFHTLPGDHPEIETTLVPGEIVTSVELPRLGFSKNSAYIKARDRASFAFALASAAVALEFDQNAIKAARVALGGVATKPWRSAETESALVGNVPSEELFANAAKLASSGAKTRPDNDFKRTLVQRVVQAALVRAWKRT